MRIGIQKAYKLLGEWFRKHVVVPSAEMGTETAKESDREDKDNIS